jgi:hypothetical protein
MSGIARSLSIASKGIERVSRSLLGPIGDGHRVAAPCEYSFGCSSHCRFVVHHQDEDRRVPRSLVAGCRRDHTFRPVMISQSSQSLKLERPVERETFVSHKSDE